MRLISFQIKNCFGFYDSGEVNLHEENKLIYILGKNSSGKTSFLTALSYLNNSQIPQNDLRFKNFNTVSEPPVLFAKFSVQRGDISLETFFQDVLMFLKKQYNIYPGHPFEKEKKWQDILEDIKKQLSSQYGELINQMNLAGIACVQRGGNGIYCSSFDSSYQDVQAREKEIEHLLIASFPNNQLTINNVTTKGSISFGDIEGILFQQFPQILFFQNSYSLIDPLPKSITLEQVNDPYLKGPLAAILTLFGKDNLKRYLEVDSPSLRQQFLEKMQEQVNVLTTEINHHQTTSVQPSTIEWLKVTLDRNGDGLQITFKTSGKESFHFQLSDNTKILFAYYLYQHAYKLNKKIILFDEPNSGFHASAQEQLLHFLKELGVQGNLVIVSTHSEYLIDPDYLSGVRLMSVDEKQSIIVQNHFYRPLPGKRQGDYLALRPITDAIGLKYGSAKLQAHDKVVIVEGVTDMLYLRGFHQILGNTEPLNIAPCRGNDTILHVIPLFISQHISFKIVVDTEIGDNSIKNKIKRGYGIEDIYIREIPIPLQLQQEKCSGIEDLFSKVDFKKLVESKFPVDSTEFDSQSNSKYINHSRSSSSGNSGPKRLIAEHFYQNSATHKKEDFDTDTIANFSAILDFCKNDDWLTV